MSQERLSMRKIEEILRLKYEAGLTHRAIAQSCSVSPSTVSEYVTHAKAAGLSWPLPDELSAEQLEALLFPQRGSASGRSIPQPDWAEVHKELRRKGVTLSLLWVEYRQEQPGGYGYSQFCHHYRQWAKQLKPMMRQKHKAGEKLFVDYAGQTVPVVDPQTGGDPASADLRGHTGCQQLHLQRSALVTRPTQLDWGAHSGAGLPGRRS